MKKFTKRRPTLLVTLLLLACAGARAAENVTVTVSKIKDLNIRIYGFAETDLIMDSTQGLTEEQGNTAISRRTTSTGADNFAGKHPRTQMSVRNSRLGFDLSLPKLDNGLATQGIIELDMLGNNGTNAAPGSGPGTQTERDFFNNPAVRVRHLYLNVTKDAWNAKVGQTWSLLGWQPYYFPGEVVVLPGVGQLYRRFAQARVTHTDNLPYDLQLEQAADLAKPAEMNSGLPEWHGGLRLASKSVKAASVGGAGGSMVAMSAAVSGAIIPVRTDAGNATGEAFAFDYFLPILASKDGQDKSNNLSLGGEYMLGRGVGGLEYSGLSAGVPGVTATSGGKPAGTAIDSGIAGINGDNNVELVQFRTFRTHITYTLPDPKWTVSGGYAQVEGRNLNHFSNAFNTNGGGVGFTPKKQYGYIAAFFDPTNWFRLGAELNQTRDTYNDVNNRFAINNRFQVSSFFVF